MLYFAMESLFTVRYYRLAVMEVSRNELRKSFVSPNIITLHSELRKTRKTCFKYDLRV